jgi:hypothetical protein
MIYGRCRPIRKCSSSSKTHTPPQNGEARRFSAGFSFSEFACPASHAPMNLMDGSYVVTPDKGVRVRVAINSVRDNSMERWRSGARMEFHAFRAQIQGIFSHNLSTLDPHDTRSWGIWPRLLQTLNVGLWCDTRSWGICPCLLQTLNVGLRCDTRSWGVCPPCVHRHSFSDTPTRLHLHRLGG